MTLRTELKVQISHNTFPQYCHPDEGRIFARNSSIVVDSVCGNTGEDPSFVRMTSLGIIGMFKNVIGRNEESHRVRNKCDF